uniref:Uncharacterized protein n=1 Tax=Coccolithus braarudii TaxID=221442 RepID=A0A7S0L491_9EUKA|mmetsp:Transcript_16756/g.36289  ORF Transcript_16756/g.36289 Transcript_16756/m.36289 type:complete len:180 (+) Transcript_16756:631-1170(+)
MAYAGADDVRVRVEVSDPQDRRQTKLVPLAEYLEGWSRKGERPPILTSTDRVRKAQMATGVYKQRAEVADGAVDISSEKLVFARAELEQAERRHALELAQVREELEQARRQHALELTQVREEHVSECKGLRMRHASELTVMATELTRLEQALRVQTQRADDAWAWTRIERRRVQGHKAQ